MVNDLDRNDLEPVARHWQPSVVLYSLWCSSSGCLWPYRVSFNVHCVLWVLRSVCLPHFCAPGIESIALSAAGDMLWTTTGIQQTSAKLITDRQTRTRLYLYLGLNPSVPRSSKDESGGLNSLHILSSTRIRIYMKSLMWSCLQMHMVSQ